jgi:lactate dehydrogenase-like 2-hydroxyacid dehydrogenase
MKLLEKHFTDIDKPEKKLSREEFLQHAHAADIIIAKGSDTIDKEVLAGKKLKLVSTVAAGMDRIDIDEATRRKILLANTHVSLEDTCADTIMGLILACRRRLMSACNYVKGGKWNTTWSDVEPYLGDDVHHKTMGIIGAGHIGQAVARRAKGFDMKVSFFDRGDGRAAFEKLLKESDFVSICCPLTKETHHMFGKKEFDLMKPNAIIANIGRGPIIDHEALADALEAKKIYGAALDVTEPEPLPVNHRLMKIETAVIAPHIGSATHETRAAMAMEAVRACVQYLKGEKISNCSNPQLYN